MFPSELGFAMPPEWSEHMGTLMEWPIKEALWPEPFEEVLEAFANTAKSIAQFEPVIMIARPELAEQAQRLCGGGIKILEMLHDDSWMRDNGPTFVINSRGELSGINWRFNAWGGKYPFNYDDMVAFKVLNCLEIPCFDAPLIMEGGSIHVDGEGTVLTTEQCLLNANRNPHMNKDQIEDMLKKYLGAKKIIWLKNGLYGDDTDGHIDNVACFAGPGKVIVQISSDKNNPNYERSAENLEILKGCTDAQGRFLEIIEIEQPGEELYDGAYLTLSYINFYFVNGGIILPVFGGKHSETDSNAKNVLQRAFPDRRIVAVDGMPIARGGGNVHCITQQMPRGVPAGIF
ncbi:agmatine deiminase [Anaerobacterium chartisolvens]|uniref:Putative agmatine deiminase n=1 Tax=Anaerobacterium chartisolvens TaxID=1297424 RepID=A0A369BHC2_9FIRM|nr:agmatine deiminase family protein [Anaerobacterium chartisolvens]RCX19956.1 agmatine deiminase [Anaerobacterium chartisolvens]